MSRKGVARAISLVAAVLASGCFALKPSSGGAQRTETLRRPVDARDVRLPPGYVIDAVASELVFPTQVLFDDAGRTYVVEAGYSYGGAFTEPRILRLEPDGSRTTVVTGENPPWTGAVFKDGAFFIAEGGGRVVRATGDGVITPLVEGLPSFGDHFTSGPTFGPDGALYFSQGTMTNSAVVGLDNIIDFHWVRRKPEGHDVPCRDVVLTGENFRTANPLTEDPDDEAVTGAYVAFGTSTQPGQVIAGRVPCSGAVMKVAPEGGAPQLVAWGFRNLYGMAFAPDRRLYVTENGFDVRGSRPIFGAADLLWAVEPGSWYGWPDFSAGRPVWHPRYQPPDAPVPPRLLKEHPNTPPTPVAHFAVHSSSNGLDFSRSEAFGHVGEAFVAQFGDLAPGVGKVWAPVGFRVVRVDVTTGRISAFAVNHGEANGPASAIGSGGLERPVAVRFDPGGEALYVVDFGILSVEDLEPDPVGERQEMLPVKGTGVLWRIRKEGSQ